MIAEANSFELLDSGRYLKPSYARKTTGKIQPVLDIEWYKRMGGIDIEQAAAFFRVDAAALVAGQGFEPWTSGYVAMAVICVCRRSVYRVGSFKIVLFIMAVGMFSDERIEAI